MVFSSFIYLGIVAVSFIMLGYKKYRSNINPISSYAVLNLIGFTFVSSLIALEEVKNGNISPYYLNFTNLCALLVAFGYLVPFLSKKDILKNLYKFLFISLSLNGLKRPLINKSSFFLCLLLSLTFYYLLASSSGNTELWLTNPREAYMNFRRGAGHFFALAQIFLIFSFINYLFCWGKKNLFKIILATIVWCCASYYTGSKGSVVAIVITFALYVNFSIKKLSLKKTAFAVICSVVLFFFLLIRQETYETPLEALIYFQDYSKTSARFLEEIWEGQDLQFGRIMLGDLWFYVPRTFYNQKPYEYGILKIHEILFPGLAELGHTPGIHLWAGAMWDFGFVGLFLYGLAKGCMARSSFDFFLKYPTNGLAFTLMIQFSMFRIFYFGTVPVLCLLILFLGFSSLLNKATFRTNTSI